MNRLFTKLAFIWLFEIIGLAEFLKPKTLVVDIDFPKSTVFSPFDWSSRNWRKLLSFFYFLNMIF